MSTALTLLTITALFGALGWVSDRLVFHVRALGKMLGIPLTILGFLLGICTTMPDFAVGVSALSKGVGSIPFGNLTGGVLVLLGLVLGVSIFFRRGIDTGEYGNALLMVLPYLLVPLGLSMDGVLSRVDGFILIACYVFLALFLFSVHRRDHLHVGIVRTQTVYRHLILVLITVVLLLTLSHVIVQITLDMLSGTAVSPFLVGLLGFSIGTNLPEIAIALGAARHQAHGLSFTNLLGSAAANPFALGMLTFFRPIEVSFGVGYQVLLVSTLGLMLLVTLFWKTHTRFSRVEGAVLVGVYLLFVVLQTVSVASAG